MALRARDIRGTKLKYDGDRQESNDGRIGRIGRTAVTRYYGGGERLSDAKNRGVDEWG